MTINETNMKSRGYKVTGAVREAERIVISFDIYETVSDERRVLSSANHAFPLTLSEQEVEEEVAKCAKTYFNDREQAKANAERERVAAEAESTVQSLNGKESSV